MSFSWRQVKNVNMPTPSPVKQVSNTAFGRNIFRSTMAMALLASTTVGLEFNNWTKSWAEIPGGVGETQPPILRHLAVNITM